MTSAESDRFDAERTAYKDCINQMLEQVDLVEMKHVFEYVFRLTDRDRRAGA